MKRFLRMSVGIAALFFAVTANAQSSRTPELLNVLAINRGVGELVPSGFVGVGARAMGMGGAQIAVVNDGTALYWNPAMLAYIPRVELSGGISLIRSNPSSTFGAINPTDASASANYTRLNNLLVAAPYPVYRGGFTIAFGATRPTDFAYRSHREGELSHVGKTFSLDDKIRNEGGLSEYAIGFGVQVSEMVSLGATGTWYRGGADITRDVSLVQHNPAAGALPDEYYGAYDETQKISGFMFSVGTAVRLPHDLMLGVVVTPPLTYTIKTTWGQEYEEYEGDFVYPYPYSESSFSYGVRRPWKFGIGTGWTTYALTLAGDVWYEDWTQARYRDRSPFDSDASVNAATYFEDRYRSTVRWHIGAEYLVPIIKTKARVGYYSAPDPFVGPVLATNETVRYVDEAGYFALGLGWLIDNVVAFDVTYTTGGDKYRAGSLVEDRYSRQILVTAAFRF